MNLLKNNFDFYTKIAFSDYCHRDIINILFLLVVIRSWPVTSTPLKILHLSFGSTVKEVLQTWFINKSCKKKAPQSDAYTRTETFAHDPDNQKDSPSYHEQYVCQLWKYTQSFALSCPKGFLHSSPLWSWPLIISSFPIPFNRITPLTAVRQRNGRLIFIRKVPWNKNIQKLVK